ncbi:MAG TPA: hypothetical protein VGP33_13655 [Chloroflexota bacterium]|jgi:MoxR-like ATPase|nr:hypothetical protein [Chloroflexota bacterium]
MLAVQGNHARLREVYPAVIAGQAGSGKSTLARQLAARLGIPCHLSDEIACDAFTHRRCPDGVRSAATPTTLPPRRAPWLPITPR